ncbi:MAG: DUF2721 domain-containing protein [Pirellulales bacterium]|nr:DUF2721 domain-containing protein [Pirellulales bacterium]
MTITTPALLFPAISLLLLAYTNRFLVLAQLIRQLHSTDRDTLSELVVRQIDNLRKRISLIKSMQYFGVLSFVFCTFSMFAIFLGHSMIGEWLFGASLILLVVSLIISLYEIQISCDAINIELGDLEERK